MLTKEQALTAGVFHMLYRGKCVVWRRNGAAQTWKTRPTEFRIPVRYGMYRYQQITQENAAHFHVESECPNLIL